MFWWIFNASDSAEQRSTGSSFAHGSFQSKLAATVRDENKLNHHYKLQNTKVLNSKKN